MGSTNQVELSYALEATPGVPDPTAERKRLRYTSESLESVHDFEEAEETDTSEHTQLVPLQKAHGGEIVTELSSRNVDDFLAAVMGGSWEEQLSLLGNDPDQYLYSVRDPIIYVFSNGAFGHQTTAEVLIGSLRPGSIVVLSGFEEYPLNNGLKVVKEVVTVPKGDEPSGLVVPYFIVEGRNGVDFEPTGILANREGAVYNLNVLPGCFVLPGGLFSVSSSARRTSINETAFSTLGTSPVIYIDGFEDRFSKNNGFKVLKQVRVLDSPSSVTFDGAQAQGSTTAVLSGSTEELSKVEVGLQFDEGTAAVVTSKEAAGQNILITFAPALPRNVIDGESFSPTSTVLLTFEGEEGIDFVSTEGVIQTQPNNVISILPLETVRSGKTRPSFSVSKKLQNDMHHMYTGCLVEQVRLEHSTGRISSAAVSLLSSRHEQRSTQVLNAALSEPFKGLPIYGPVVFGAVRVFSALGGQRATSFELLLNRRVGLGQGLGSLDSADGSLSTGRLRLEGSFEIYFENGNAYDLFLKQPQVRILVYYGRGSDAYAWELIAVKITASRVVAGRVGSALLASFDFQSEFLRSDTRLSILEIHRVDKRYYIGD